MCIRGRPTLYRPDLCAVARELSRRGASNDQLATAFGVAPRSIDNWIARIPEFAAAVDEGRAAVRGEMARKLYQRAVGWQEPVERVVRLAGGRTTTVTYMKHHLPETRACIRYLYLRRPQDWRRRPDLPADARQNRVAPAAHIFGDWQPADRDDVEVVNALHQRGMGCRQIVERVVTCWGEPRIIAYERHHPPHHQAGVVWLTNRLPEQWKPLAAFSPRTVSPAAHKLPAAPAAESEERAAATDALNRSRVTNHDHSGRDHPARSATALPFIPRQKPEGSPAGGGLVIIRELPRPWSRASPAGHGQKTVNRHSLRHKPAGFLGVMETEGAIGSVWATAPP